MAYRSQLLRFQVPPQFISLPINQQDLELHASPPKAYHKSTQSFGAKKNDSSALEPDTKPAETSSTKKKNQITKSPAKNLKIKIVESASNNDLSDVFYQPILLPKSRQQYILTDNDMVSPVMVS